MAHGRVPTVGILTCANDLHALVIERCLAERFGVNCGIVEVDSFADHPTGLTWSTSADFAPRLPVSGGLELAVSEIDVIWYRRAHMPQLAAKDLSKQAVVDVINYSCTATLMGILTNHFRGRWVSDPEATRAAENKLVQLDAARNAGMRVPRTVTSQDPAVIKEFCDDVDGKVIMKSLRAARDRHLLTVEVSPEVHQHPENLRLCPTIFQEFVPGTRHLRVLACGNTLVAFAIDSPDVDWRPNLDVPVSVVTLEADTHAQILQIMSTLRLRMGVFDLKLDDDGPVWLEVNPQGQFLFLEGMSGVDLTTTFAEFLWAEASAAI